VTVASARTAAPAISPVEALTPEGTSTETTGRPEALICSIIRVTSSRGASFKPVPSSVHDHVGLADLAEALNRGHLAASVASGRGTWPSRRCCPGRTRPRRCREALDHDLGDRRPARIIAPRATSCASSARRLLGGEQRQERHRVTTATAAASSRECVIDSSIRPAPIRAANAAVRPLR
jgi:hypothetical protein